MVISFVLRCRGDRAVPAVISPPGLFGRPCAITMAWCSMMHPSQTCEHRAIGLPSRGDGWRAALRRVTRWNERTPAPILLLTVVGCGEENLVRFRAPAVGLLQCGRACGRLRLGAGRIPEKTNMRNRRAPDPRWRAGLSPMPGPNPFGNRKRPRARAFAPR